MEALESRPFFDFESVMNWKPAITDFLRKTSSNHWKKKFDSNSSSQTLICHDMKGGFLSDKWSLGSPEADSYRFWHWWQIDIFVYFSHCFITIPPTGWIKAGHKNGVKVLGTLITEWDQGHNLCSQFLKNEQTWQMFARKLVELSIFFGFDGWLINIENILDTAEVTAILEFVRYLTEKQHEEDKDAMVLWYDSVTVEGKLLWQNELNDKNFEFFRQCDGIFLNYAWTTEQLDNSISKLIKQKGEEKRIFVGIDVFGTECHHLAFDDFTYDTSKMVAPDVSSRQRKDGCDVLQCMNMAIERKMSSALFAQGWTHEVLGKENFFENELRFWSKLNRFSSDRKLNRLPLVTTFCQGFGEAYFYKNQKLSNTPWYNMGLQSLQPVYNSSFNCCTKTSYMGGSCLRISLVKEGEGLCQPATFKLFNMDVEFDNRKDVFLNVSCSFKVSSALRMVLILHMDASLDSDIKDLDSLKNDSNSFSMEKEITDMMRGKLKSMESCCLSLNGCDVLEVNPIKSFNDVEISQLPVEETSWKLSSVDFNDVCSRKLKGVYVFAEPVYLDKSANYDLYLGYLEIRLCDKVFKDPTSDEKANSCDVILNFVDGQLITEICSQATTIYSSFKLILLDETEKDCCELKNLQQFQDICYGGFETDSKDGDNERQVPNYLLSDDRLVARTMKNRVLLVWETAVTLKSDDNIFHIFIGNFSNLESVFVGATPATAIVLDNLHVLQLLKNQKLKINVINFSI